MNYGRKKLKIIIVKRNKNLAATIMAIKTDAIQVVIQEKQT